MNPKTLKEMHIIQAGVGYEDEGSEWVNLKGLRKEVVKWKELDNLRNLVREFRHSKGPWISAIHEEGEFWSNIEFGNWLINKMNNLEEDAEHGGNE